jgi:GTP cyclohydrolase III
MGFQRKTASGLSMSFLRHDRSMNIKNGLFVKSKQSIQFDIRRPSKVSLAGCSPAEPASV